MALSPGPSAQAAGTPAGTGIANTAVAAYLDTSGLPQTASSNTSTVIVAERLDVVISSNDPGNVSATSPDSDKPLAFTITNTGNGVEIFTLAANTALGGDQFDPIFVRIVLDSNGNGIYEPGIDTSHVPGTNDPALNPDQSLAVFLICDIPGGLNNNDVALSRLTVTAATGSGAPGTIFPGQGTGGTDAVVGATTATASSQNGYVVSQMTTTLVKSQSVADPFGGTNPIPGAVITYTLTFTVSGTGSITNTLISDTIPANTTYAAGSIRLDGSPLTDAPDADAGLFTGTEVQVGLGTVAAPATRTVVFQVRIN